MDRGKNTHRIVWLLALMALILMAIAASLRWQSGPSLESKKGWQAGPASKGALELTWDNYADQVMDAAEEFDLPPAYLLALITLECSGREPAGKRFESGVHKRLLDVQSGERRKYEQVKTAHLEDATPQAVENLATSWGPFQLMGYKCIGMDVNVSDIRGEEAVFYGAKWMNEEYGNRLRNEKFKDAFHIHNTGRKYPKVGPPRTHDPQYVEKGLERMAWFRKRMAEQD